MPVLDVRDLRVHHVHRRPVPACRPAVVFVHGAGGTHQNWLYQVRDLPQAPTYAVDLPGHGRSEGTGYDSIEGYGEWLVAFLDAAGLDQAVLVGHSMGGAIALHVALHHPARSAGLGLVGTGARLRVAPALFELIGQDCAAAANLICEWAFGPDAPAEMVRLAQRQMAATPPEVLRGDLLACDAFDVMGQLARVAVPAAVISGTQDRLAPLKYSTYLRDAIRDARLHLVDGAGHMVMLENPVAVSQALAQLLERI
jgi:pimeloyl-ACP methyl ester carboxylesterase